MPLPKVPEMQREGRQWHNTGMDSGVEQLAFWTSWRWFSNNPLISISVANARAPLKWDFTVLAVHVLETAEEHHVPSVGNYYHMPCISGILQKNFLCLSVVILEVTGWGRNKYRFLLFVLGRGIPSMLWCEKVFSIYLLLLRSSSSFKKSKIIRDENEFFTGFGKDDYLGGSPISGLGLYSVRASDPGKEGWKILQLPLLQGK